MTWRHWRPYLISGVGCSLFALHHDPAPFFVIHSPSQSSKLLAVALVDHRPPLLYDHDPYSSQEACRGGGQRRTNDQGRGELLLPAFVDTRLAVNCAL